MKEKYMLLAIKQAEKAYKNNEVPIGAIIVKDNKVIAKAYNKKESKKSAIEHAEIIAIKRACKKLKNWRLIDCSIYVTTEPCLMCYGAIKEARMNKIFFGIENDNFGFSKKIKTEEEKVIIEKGILASECQILLKKFFNKKRTKTLIKNLKML